MDWLENAINKQRGYIRSFLAVPLGQLEQICARHWHDRNSLDKALQCYLQNMPDHRCRLLYAVDKAGYQYSSNITESNIDGACIGQDLSERPYLSCIDDSGARFMLSDVYVDKQTRRPCITAINSIEVNQETCGYIAADFGLKDLPLKNMDGARLYEWRQIKGDPSIRETLFQQTRTPSAMDACLEDVLDVVESLMTEQGVFHAKLHFSSSRATLWPLSDPCRYRLHVLDEIINPKVCLAYPQAPYPAEGMVPSRRVQEILRLFKSLREVDDVIYLRAASLNIMNGLVGLNFSCDGTHYLPADEFVNKDVEFWVGKDEMACNL